MHVPVITLTTDFGLSDHYVAAMKAVLLTRVPAARIVDVTHDVPRHSVLAGSFVLERAVASFPADTVHVAVVDPGVGSARRILVVELRAQRVICPDNGLITWAWRSHPAARAYELTWRPVTSSHTFHGRDVMVPAAAQLATGTPLEELARPITDPILLPVHPATEPHGQIIHIDHFGNCTTNIPAHVLPAAPFTVRTPTHNLGPLRRTYADVPPGHPLALIGSSDLLEIALNSRSAAEKLGLQIGTSVSVGHLD